MSLWIEASRDVEEERRIEAIAAANKALVDVHGIVMQASTAQEFEDRMAVVAERVEGVVACVTASSPMLFPIVHSAVLDGLSIDFDRVQEVRRAEQQRSAAKRAFFRRQRREAMEVTNTEWGIAYMTRSQPYSPAVTLSVSRTDDSVPNQWGGMGIVIKHPEYDGLQFPDMESAKAFTREKGLVREARTATASRTAALTCPKCKTPVNEGARIFDHGDHEVLKAKCPSCGWSGSKKKPKTKSASVHTAMTQSEADAVLAAVKNPEHRKALEKFTPYLVYGPGYSRGITENFMDAVRSSNRGEDRYFNISFSKLEAHLDIINGGDADQWAFDREMGIYTKKLFSSKISGYQDLVEGLSGRYGLAVVKAKEDAAAAGLDPSSDDYWKRVYNQAVWDADYSRLAWAQQGELWTAKTGSLTAEAAQTSPSLVAWGVYDDVRGRVIAEGSARDLATAKQAAEWSIVTKEKGRQLDGPFGSMDEAQKRWEREYEPDSTEVRESARRTAVAVEEFPMVMRDGEWITTRDVLDKQEYAAFKNGKATLFYDLIVGKAYLVLGDWKGFQAEHPELELGSVVVDPRNRTGSKTAADYTKTPKSVKLKDGTVIPDVMGTDPDPGHPDGKVWIGFDSNGARRKWHNDDVASTDDVEFTLNTSWVDERMDQQRESRRRVAEFPPKKDDEKKSDPANDKTDSDKDGEQDGPVQPGEQPEDQASDPSPGGAQDQTTPTTPTTEGQTDQEQTPSDPTMMDVGQSSMMSYTMADGGTGSIEVTFVREQNGVYFFNGPEGEFGVGQQNGQWQDSAGNVFAWGGQQAPAPAQQPAPAPNQPAAPQPQQPPQQQAPANDAPPADKGSSDKKDEDDDKKKDGPPWAKK